MLSPKLYGIFNNGWMGQCRSYSFKWLDIKTTKLVKHNYFIVSKFSYNELLHVSTKRPSSVKDYKIQQRRYNKIERGLFLA
jgi:hypothetical protein